MRKRILDRFAMVISICSIALLISATLAYATRPDWCAAATFIPAWIWTLAGVLSALLCAFVSSRSTLCFILAWMLFAGWFVEEAKSLVFSSIYADRAMNFSRNQGTLLIVSLNCAGGNINAARELIALKPDAVLLQERPSDLNDLRELADELCGSGSILACGSDTAVIARGTLISDGTSDSTNQFLSHARIRLQDGKTVALYSIRLQPPVIDTDLLSLECWQAHGRDRVARRKQLRKAIAEFTDAPVDAPIIFGGDFNVPAHDGSLNELQKSLYDGFSQGGWGIGNTAINTLPLFRVDQIWCSRSIRTEFASAIKSKYSDHRIVVGYYRLPD